MVVKNAKNEMLCLQTRQKLHHCGPGRSIIGNLVCAVFDYRVLPSIRKYTKGVSFLPKMVYKRVGVGLRGGGGLPVLKFF